MQDGSPSRAAVPSLPGESVTTPDTVNTSAGVELQSSRPQSGTSTKSKARGSAGAPSATDEATAVRKLQKSISGRRDALVVGRGRSGRIRAVLEKRPRRCNVLVLVPTRSMAMEAGEEADEVANGTRIIVVAGKGPEALADPARNANFASVKSGSAIVIATPRALCDSFFKSGQGPNWLQTVERLVLYDLEWMNSIGCLRQVRRVLKFLPETQKRQTIVFVQSSSVGTVNALTKTCLRPCVDTIEWNSVHQKTADTIVAEVAHRYASVPEDKLLAALADVLSDIGQMRGHKAMVFFHTARMTQFYARLCKELGIVLEEVHARRSPASQVRALETFCESESMILFTSEMSATRGSLPYITHLVHFGAPIDTVQYKSRVAMAMMGVACTSLLILPEYETEFALEKLSEDIILNGTNCYPCTTVADRIKENVSDLVSEVPDQLFHWVYSSWLSVHTSRRKKLGWTRADLVKHARIWFESSTGRPACAISKRTADRLSLWGVPGVDVGDIPEDELSRAVIYDNPAVDRSLEQRKGRDREVGMRGKLAVPRKLKPKKLKIEDWREVLRRREEEENRDINKLVGNVSQEDMLLAQQRMKEKAALAAAKKEEAAREAKVLARKKKKAADAPKKTKRKPRVRIDSWAPAFAAWAKEERKRSEAKKK